MVFVCERKGVLFLAGLERADEMEDCVGGADILSEGSAVYAGGILVSLSS